MVPLRAALDFLAVHVEQDGGGGGERAGCEGLQQRKDFEPRHSRRVAKLLDGMLPALAATQDRLRQKDKTKRKTKRNKWAKSVRTCRS
jgi:hypothetical protein